MYNRDEFTLDVTRRLRETQQNCRNYLPEETVLASTPESLRNYISP